MAEALRKFPPAAPARDEALEPPRPQVEPVPAAKESAGKSTSATAQRHRQRSREHIRWGLFALLPIALVGGFYQYVTGGQIVSTDDAYVEAMKVGVSTDVSGLVENVYVTDNEHVTAGQVLYRLDPAKFKIALDNAKAKLAQTALKIEAMEQDYKRMLSDVAAQAAQVRLDRTNYDRDVKLLRTGTVSQAIFDQAKSTLQTDRSKLQALREVAQEQLARLGGSPNIALTKHPQYLRDEAKVEEAQRQLNHSVVTAPFAGIVTDVSAIAPGKYLAASATAFYLVDTARAWIDADPKESDLTHVRPGQPVTVTVDSYPSVQWRGTVESISPAAAEEFALLPAQNTSGNWVKVVQRVPMRVRLDQTNKSLPPLRAGMSAEVEIDTGHARGFPHLLSALF